MKVNFCFFKKITLMCVLSCVVGCVSINRNSTFKYKTAEDWKTMTPIDVQMIIDNGADVSDDDEWTKEGSPLNMACWYNSDLNVILLLIQNGEDPNRCDLVSYYNNSHKSIKNFFNDVDQLIKKGFHVEDYQIDELIEAIPEHKMEIMKYFSKEIKNINYRHALLDINDDPLNAVQIMRKYDVSIPEKELVITKFNSQKMQEQRNTKEWYQLIDQMKKLHIKDGIVGMSKSDFILKYGVPSKEYSLNDNTVLLVYTYENRTNIPAVISTNSYGISKGYFDGSSTKLNLFNTISYRGNLFGSSSEFSTTNISGGYVDVKKWEEVIIVDKGIVTGRQIRDLINTD